MLGFRDTIWWRQDRPAVPLAVLTLLAAGAYVPAIPSGSTAGRWWVMALGVPLLLWSRPVLPRPGPGHLWGAALLGWGILSLLWTTNTWDTLAELWLWALVAGAFLLASGERDLRLVWVALSLGVSVSLPFALLQRAGYQPLWNVANSGDPVGLFLSKPMFGEAAALGVVASFAGVPGRWRGWRLTLAAPNLACVWLSSSRGAVLGLVLAGLSCMWVNQLRWTVTVICALLGCLATGTVLWLWVADPAYLMPLLERLDIWADAMSNLRLFGWGPGTYGTLWPYEWAHSELFRLAFELGLGLALLMGVLTYALGAPCSTPEKAIMVCLLGLSLTWDTFHDPLPALVLGLVAGGLCGARDRARGAPGLDRVAGAPGLDAAWAVPTRAVWPPGGGGADLPARPQRPPGGGAVCPVPQ